LPISLKPIHTGILVCFPDELSHARREATAIMQAKTIRRRRMVMAKRIEV